MTDPAAAARWATAPDPGSAHQLGAVEQVAAMLGTPLMPWQSQVARVATETLPDGRWRYPVVVVTVPRQSGKTTLMRSVLTQRAITRQNLLAFYTAQTGKDAGARWNDLVSAVEESPMQHLVKKRLQAGSQALIFPNGSRIAPFAPTPKSLHGYTPPLVMVDEAFAFDAAQGTALEGAIRPAQITLADRQLWIVSTAGSADSTWLRRWVDLGRQSVEAPGEAAGVAYFEWSAADGVDLYDPAVWWSFHPALGHTITEAALAADAATQSRGEWERAYGNRWTITRTAWFPMEEWNALAGDVGTPGDRRVGLAYGIRPDRSEAALVAAWVDSAGVAHVQVLEAGAGVDWLTEATRRAEHVLGVTAHAADDGPRQITDDRTAADLDTVTVGSRDYATACGAILWRASNGQLVHDGSPALSAAVLVAQTRPMGDGGWGFSRTHSDGSVAALEAAALAIRAADYTPTAAAPVVFWSGDAA